jgi:membrane protein DedA with SNARE-associated domain
MDVHFVLHFFSHYGLLVLFLWLVIGIFIVPIPEEVVMLSVGILISQGDFTYFAYFVACVGSLCGVTFSYFLGRYLGRIFIVKYGKWIGVTAKRLAQAEQLFMQHGKWNLPLSYFVPGTRHLVAVVAGTTHYDWKHFAFFTYPAGVIWVALLVTLGYLAGDYWLRIFHLAVTYFYYFIIFLCVLIVGFLIYWFQFHKKPKQ